MKMAFQIKAIDDFCRLCAIESQTGVIIYSAEGENLCLEEKIINCLRIEISRDDLLPKRVCQSCNMLLEDYYKFSERATQVQQTLYCLLGLHIPHVQEQGSGLSLMEDRVKVESSMIKKELDEFIIQQGNVHIEENLAVGREEGVSKEFDMKSNERQNEFARIGVENEGFGLNILMEGSEMETQKRKIIIPKKRVQDKNMEENIERVMCFLEDIENNENMLRSQVSGEKAFLVSNEEEEISSEEDEEHKKMGIEWRKQWGILCDQCQSVFTERLLFEKHYKFSHNKQPLYTCSYCKKSVKRHSSYKVHIFEHIFHGRFKCKFCDRKLRSKEMLKIHLTALHNQMKFLICEECGMIFTSQPRLDFHLKRHKRKPPQEDLRCTECGKILQTRGGLAAHKSTHKLGRHYMCHICGKTFTQKVNMQQHVKHHKGEKPHVCAICQKRFAEKAHLNRHQSFHTKDRPFQCSVCKKTYKTERCLKVHAQIHCNSRPYICSYCGKGFLSSTKLKQHHNCHTGERPFACKYCERTFTNYPNWLKHTRRRHKVDHKTGLSLKEEEKQTPTVSAVNQVVESVGVTESAIEFVEIPEVKVMEDGGESGQLQHSVFNMINPSLLSDSQFEIVQESDCQYEMIPDLVSTQEVYSDQVILEQPTYL